MNESLPLLENQRSEIEGTIERIIFHNPENGFSVIRVQPDKKDGAGRTVLPEVMVGHMSEPKIGSRMNFCGQYIKNPKYGRQFSFDLADEVMPVTAEGIRLYLASGLIKGVGPRTAAKIVDKFGVDTIRVLDEEPERLDGLKGVSRKTLENIKTAWGQHRGMRDLLLFLQPHGVSAAYAVRIYRAYGEDSMRVVRENPYRLAMDIHGIGFITADGIAMKLGFRPDHPLRVQAAVLYILQKASDDGHVYLPKDALAKQVIKQLEVDADLVDQAVRELEGTQRIIAEEFDGGESGQIGIYLKRYHHCESKIAYYLQRLLNSPKTVRFTETRQTIDRITASLPITLAEEQARAIELSTREKVMVITGGPGTGKTTIINAIIKVFEAVKAKVLLAAPTGRAAKRMAETSGRDAKTIHRLLEYSPRDDKFGRNEDCPLSCGLLIIDEASMMDTLLFYHLLKAIPLGATVIFVGDAHQLPSVGPGNVLGDMIASGTVNVVSLNEIFRQSAESEIICSAHLINRGQMPLVERNPDKLSDFYFLSREDPEEAANSIIEMIKYHIPRKFGFDPVNEIQLLTPMHKGAIGAESMNSRLQLALNPNSLEIRRRERSFRLHDKVMQVRNNYDKDIFNGDMGRITHINPQARTLSVDFDGIVMPYEYDELDELVPAYAISIHKSQGSEYPAVVIPVMMQHYIMLQRNLIYTGITRGKKLVVLVGEMKALQIAVRNSNTSKRYTRLAQRLASPDSF